ncbi:MAG: FAD-dependent oxidoreductase, partial [Actinomycetota bacterium]
MSTIAIVGGSLAGTQAAQALRRADYDGSLIMVGDEPHYPYDRPPLSKNYLVDEVADEERLRLRPTADPEALGIDWRLGRIATALAPSLTELTLDNDETIAFDGLVVATGARPRRLPGADGLPGGVCELRTLDDARAVRAALAAGPGRVVVCGAGFIGAEVAASARSLGLAVTLVDAAEVPLDRVLDRDAGMAVADLHRGHGVDVRLETGVAGFEERTDGSGQVAAVVLTDGTTVPADLVIIGIGVVPNTDWLTGSGLQIDDGVVVDQTCLAAAGQSGLVVAAGDVARFPNARFGGTPMRIEQWDNAVEMGMYAGKRLLAALNDQPAPDPFAPVPWFWSDQYDRKIQLAGLVADHAEVVQGSFAEQRFVQLYADGD